MQINAFDEPNVKESKDNTERLLQQLTAGGKAAVEKPTLREAGVSLFGELTFSITTRGPSPSKQANRVRDCFIAHLRQAKPGDYIAILAYVAPTPATDRAVQQLRVFLRDALGVATSLGYGPRYLHSTGQFHKGGPANGIFLEITAKDSLHLPIPSLPYSFGLLKQAQARGDQEALTSRHRRFLRLHLESGPETGLGQLVRWAERAFPPRSVKSRHGR
jgi:hypothetical protein